MSTKDLTRWRVRTKHGYFASIQYNILKKRRSKADIFCRKHADQIAANLRQNGANVIIIERYPGIAKCMRCRG